MTKETTNFQAKAPKTIKINGQTALRFAFAIGVPLITYAASQGMKFPGLTN